MEPKEIIVLRTCKCGCGQLVSPPYRFIIGHHTKGVKPWNLGLTKEDDPRLIDTRERIPCKCGCGNLVVPGHDYFRSHHLRDQLQETLPQQYCACGCGELTSPGKKLIRSHNLNTFTDEFRSDMGHKGGTTTQKRYPGFLQIMDEKWKQRDPEGYHNSRVKAGKRSHELHPNQSSDNGKRTHQLHPNQARENGIKVHKLHPNLGKENMKIARQKHPDIFVDIGKKSHIIRKEKDFESYMEKQHNAVKSMQKAWIDWDYYNEHGTYKSKAPYAEIWNLDFKEQIRKRDDYKCVITGMTNEEHKAKYNKPLFVHHWTYDKDETNPFYFATVSIPIHGLTHRLKDRAEWTDCFNGIMEDKYCEIIRGK